MIAKQKIALVLLSALLTVCIPPTLVEAGAVPTFCSTACITVYDSNTHQAVTHIGDGSYKTLLENFPATGDVYWTVTDSQNRTLVENWKEGVTTSDGRYESTGEPFIFTFIPKNSQITIQAKVGNTVAQKTLTSQKDVELSENPLSGSSTAAVPSQSLYAVGTNLSVEVRGPANSTVEVKVYPSTGFQSDVAAKQVTLNNSGLWTGNPLDRAFTSADAEKTWTIATKVQADASFADWVGMFAVGEWTTTYNQNLWDARSSNTTRQFTQTINNSYGAAVPIIFANPSKIPIELSAPFIPLAPGVYLASLPAKGTLTFTVTLGAVPQSVQGFQEVGFFPLFGVIDSLAGLLSLAATAHIFPVQATTPVTIPTPTPIPAPTPVPVPPTPTPVPPPVVNPPDPSFAYTPGPAGILPQGSRAGDLIKFYNPTTGEHYPAVYLVKADGLHPFGAESYYNFYLGQTAKTLKLLPAPNGYTIVGDVLADVVLFGTRLPGAEQLESGMLVKSGSTIYLILGNEAIPFQKWSAFTGLGYKLENVRNVDLSRYTYSITPGISSGNVGHPWGSWVSHKGTVYYSHPTGMIPVPNWESFTGNGGRAEYILPANKYDIADIEKRRLSVIGMPDQRVMH